MIGDEGRELQRLVLQASFDVDAAREERPAEPVISAAGIRTASSRPSTGGA